MRQWIRLCENELADVSKADAPGIWYHGTPYAFADFDVNAGEFESNHETPAIFLTNDPILAEAYASRERDPIDSSGLGWGDFKRDYILPTEQIIARSTAPSADYLRSNAEFVINGQYDFEKVLEYLPDVANDLRKLRDKKVAADMAAHTTEGANIRPCTVTGKFMHVRMLRDFHEGLYDLFLRQSKRAGLDGVLFFDIVDSPSGGGKPANILAVFDPQNIHSAFGFLKQLQAQGRTSAVA